MIHFDFTLDDIDAENLFGALQHEIQNIHMNIGDEMAAENRPEYISWYRERIKYIEELMQKLTHTRI
jgi:hypothetical protein